MDDERVDCAKWMKICGIRNKMVQAQVNIISGENIDVKQ